jgi:hypothetical protein
MIAKLRSHWNDIGRPLGWPTFVYSLLSELLSRGSGNRIRLLGYRIVIQPLPEASQALRTGFALEEVFEGDIRLKQFDRPADIIASRWAQGSRCFLLLREGVILGFAWFTFNRYVEDEVRSIYQLHPPERLAWDYDIYIEPAHRLGRAFQQLWLGAARELRAAGITHTASRIALTNVASLRSHAALKAETVRSAYFLVLGPWQIAVFAQPFQAFAPRSRALPILHVHLDDVA